MSRHTLALLVICAVALMAVPEASAQSSRSAVRGGYSSGGYGRMHRQDPGEDRYRESLEEDKARLKDELEKERRRRWKAEHGDDEEEEERGPSGGPACMYAADGTLVFAPRGKRCSGAAANAAAPTPRPRRQQKAESPRKPTGSCMMGADGSVIYAPPGVDCGQ